jgi:hypothetical protein
MPFLGASGVRDACPNSSADNALERHRPGVLDVPYADPIGDRDAMSDSRILVNARLDRLEREHLVELS